MVTERGTLPSLLPRRGYSIRLLDTDVADTSVLLGAAISLRRHDSVHCATDRADLHVERVAVTT